MRKLNVQKTVKLILDKCKESNDMSVKVNKFNEMIKQVDAEEIILDTCILCDVEPIYDEV